MESIFCKTCNKNIHKFICCFCHKKLCDDCIFIMSLRTIFCSRNCCREWDTHYYGFKIPKMKRKHKRKKRKRLWWNRKNTSVKLPSIRTLPDSLMIKNYKLGTVKYVPKGRKKIQQQHESYRHLPSISSLPSLLHVKKCKIQNKY